MATEDVGMADPQALVVSVAAMESCHFMGMPECDLSLAEAVVYLCAAPKSNSLYRAYGEVKADVKQYGALPVPLHIRNAPTQLLKDLGYGEGYRYAHQYPNHIVEQRHLPRELEGRRYYRPTEQGLEKRVAERLRRWRETLLNRRNGGGEPSSGEGKQR